MKHDNLFPVPKRGDITKVDNYRGISLTLGRLRTLRINQNGFRPGRSTTSHILALRRILGPAVLLFIDFKKAFDSVHRGILVKILRAYGIPPVMYIDLVDKM